MSSALVLIDWENISKEIPHIKTAPERFSRASALKKMFAWISSEVDKIFDTFVFCPLYMAYTDYQMFHDLGLFLTTCPKVPLGSPQKKDTVDPTLIERARKWITHPDITHVCLASGDSDFIPLLKIAKQRGLKIMVCALDPALARDPRHLPLSRELAEMADVSEKTGEKMVHYFSPTI